jgi:hypothetical protein
LQCSNPPEILKALQNRAKLNPTVKTVKIAEFRTPTHQDVRKKGSKILKLHVSSTVVLIIRRSELYYTASGIITLKQMSRLKLQKYDSINIYFCIYLQIHKYIFTKIIKNITKITKIQFYKYSYEYIYIYKYLLNCILVILDHSLVSVS